MNCDLPQFQDDSGSEDQGDDASVGEGFLLIIVILWYNGKVPIRVTSIIASGSPHCIVAPLVRGFFAYQSLVIN